MTPSTPNTSSTSNVSSASNTFSTPNASNAHNASSTPKNKKQKEIKPTSLRNRNVVTDRVLSIVAFILSSGIILLLVLDMLAEALNYDLIPLQTFIYYMAPLFICFGLAYLMNALATFQGHSWWNLAACILYIAAAAMYPPLWYLFVLQCFLTFASFFRMRNREVKNATAEQNAQSQDQG